MAQRHSLFNSAGILAGEISVRAEIVAAANQPPLAIAWAPPVTVGIRKRISLAGDWAVAKVDAYDYPSNWRPKDWKAPAITTVALPGPITADQWLRGWFDLKRSVSYKTGDPQLRPRILKLSHINDSVVASVNGMSLRETRPVEEMAVLTHWVEFHSPYKGEQHEKTRMLFLDLLPQLPVSLALPQALPSEGSAEVELRLRGTSGMHQPKPQYGIHGDLHLDVTGPVYVKSISFDTEKPGEMRRFHFQLIIANDTGKPFAGRLRAVYGRYDGKIAYAGNCPAYDTAEQPLSLAPGDNTIEVIRDERPRFATCRAMFMVIGEQSRILDADSADFHTVTFAIRNRRDFYLNNERFILKAQGSAGDAPHKRWQLQLMGGNGFRGPTNPAQIDLYQSEGLLTSAGGALLASCEKCTFWNPKDTSNITKAVRGYTSCLSQCPGILMWEATNELHGEPEEARVAIQEAFHKLDPYHRPVMATKASGEWEAEAADGRVKGVDVVGCQYLLSKEAVDSVTAAITEQPLMSTEVNWNDTSFPRDNLWQYWLEKGIAGSLLFDYSGSALDQPVPTVPPQDNEQVGWLIKKWNRDLYQDLVVTAQQQADGQVLVRFGNRDAICASRSDAHGSCRRPVQASRSVTRRCRDDHAAQRVFTSAAGNRRAARAVHHARRPAPRRAAHSNRKRRPQRRCKMKNHPLTSSPLHPLILCVLCGYANAQCTLTESVRKFEGADRNVVRMENARIIVEVVPVLEGRVVRYTEKGKQSSPFEWLDDCPYHYGGRWEGKPFEYRIDSKGPDRAAITVTGGGKIAVALLRQLTGASIANPIDLRVERTMSIEPDSTRLRVDVKITNTGDGVAPLFRYMVHGVFGQVPPMPQGRAFWFLPAGGIVEFFHADRGNKEMWASAGGAPVDHVFSRFTPGRKADKPRYEAGGWGAMLTSAGPAYIYYDPRKFDFMQYWFGGDAEWHLTFEPHTKPVDLKPGESVACTFTLAYDSKDVPFNTATVSYERPTVSEVLLPGSMLRVKARATTVRNTSEHARARFSSPIPKARRSLRRPSTAMCSRSSSPRSRPRPGSPRVLR